MKVASLVRSTFCCVALGLAACGQSAGSSTLPSDVVSQPSTGQAKVFPDAGDPLVYILDYSGGEVGFYKFPGFRTEGSLTGFSHPQGLCVDTSGNVWIADTGNARLVEYAHGASQPIATLADTDGDPISCSVSAKTGTLAVINSSSTEVLFYAKASGTPTAVQLAAQPTLIAYDASDDFFGLSSDNNLFEVPSGQQSATTITIQGAAMIEPDGMQFAGKVLNIHQFGGPLDRFQISGTNAKLIDAVTLGNTISCSGISIYKSKLLCPDGDLGDIGTFEYPKGTELAMHSGNFYEEPVAISAI